MDFYSSSLSGLWITSRRSRTGSSELPYGPRPLYPWSSWEKPSTLRFWLVWCANFVLDVFFPFQEGGHAQEVWFHADRIVGGDRHHCHSDRPAGACRPEGARSRRPTAMPEQPQAAGAGGTQLP